MLPLFNHLVRLVRISRHRSSLLIALVYRVMWAQFAPAPIPDVLKEAPDYILIAIHHLLVIPQVTRIEFVLLLKVTEHFEIISLNIRSICLSAMDSPNHIDSSADSIREVGKQNSRAAILRERLLQVFSLLALIHWPQEAHIAYQPLKQFVFRLFFDLLKLMSLRKWLDVESSLFVHDSLITVFIPRLLRSITLRAASDQLIVADICLRDRLLNYRFIGHFMVIGYFHLSVDFIGCEPSINTLGDG